nr:cobyric acid synthase CobQ [Paracoccaceae bacterium]
CGGYERLGNKIRDTQKIEGDNIETQGIGLINVSTTMIPEKKHQNVSGKHISIGTEISGYEMHIGKTMGPDCKNPLLMIDGKGSGAVGTNNRISGCYLHGMFASDTFRSEFLQNLNSISVLSDYQGSVNNTLDELAKYLHQNMDTDQFLNLTRSL